MSDYLDPRKSVMISSPAGSGKTEKLARRYISLLKSGSDVRRILAITFTEKAAAEMKERILYLLQEEDSALYETIKPQIPLMRISTIHAFCLKLLKRFSIELNLDPSLSVADELTAQDLWAEAVFEAIEQERQGNADLFFELMKTRGIKGYKKVIEMLNELYAKSPMPETAVREGYVEGEDEKKILNLYMRCREIYSQKKRQRHLIDFNDLEVFAEDVLSRNPSWQSILYAFDEHTDHLLVDEFQDTSMIQWRIIDKLTEEWRSGLGAKRESGKNPTMFFVGDEKQSIYRFRGANVEVFNRAKRQLSEWLGNDYVYVEIEQNYRSLPEIVNFANELFSKIMSPKLLEDWRTRYSPFKAVREEGKGKVELILLDDTGKARQNRAREASILAKNISALHGRYEVFGQDGVKRPCRFDDMVILFKQRTHLGVFEDALRKEGIPFIVLKGMGFYDEPEVALLREFVSAIVDPTDDWSIFNLLRSPLFGLNYRKLFRLTKGTQSFIERLKNDSDKNSQKAYKVLSSLIEKRTTTPLSVLIEDMLAETGAWAHFWEKQRHANIKRFISIVESLESSGRSPVEIRDVLIRQSKKQDIAKANINPEEMNAVRLMTVHAAKGLQFPMVFIPSLEEGRRSKPCCMAIDEEGGRVVICADSSEKAKDNLLEKIKQKDAEEEKRHFYVAVTRARDYLCMLGNMGEKTNGRLGYIDQAFGLGTEGRNYPFEILKESDVEKRFAQSARIEFEDAAVFMDEPAYTAPLKWEPELKWLSVTEELDVRARHGEDWVVIGSVMHRLFEEISKGLILPEKVKDRASVVLAEEALGGDTEKVLDAILGDFEKLRTSGYLSEIICPTKNSFAELPFHLTKGRTIFKGRIDRLIISGDIARIYDYKTFPVKARELPELIEKYKFQMEIYKEAAERLFGIKAKAYLLFTHTPELIEVF